MTTTQYSYCGSTYAADEVAAVLADHGLPVCPGELDNAQAAPLMLAELGDLGWRPLPRRVSSPAMVR